MPSPWSDRNRYNAAARYLEGSYERLLSRLSTALNEAHGVHLSPRYWRILIGPWLIYFLHACYDRTTHLRDAFEREPSLNTILLDRSSFRLPLDSRETMDLLVDAPYNLQIISELLEGMGRRFPSRPSSPNWSASPLRRARTASPLRRLLRASARPLQRQVTAMLSGRCQAALFHTDLPKTKLWQLAWRSGMKILPIEMPERFTVLPAAPDERRRKLLELPAEDEFERLFVRLLPQNLPAIYWEGFSRARAETLSGPGKKPAPVLLSTVGWHFHEPFKFLAAEAALRGRRLIAAQHGGGYGLYRFAPQEQHERRVSDRFLCWGWANGDKKLENVPAPKLSPLLAPHRKQRGNLRAKQTALFVASTDSPYAYRFYSAPQGSRLPDYFDGQRRFLEALPETLRPKLLFRCHPQDFGHGLRPRLCAEFPWLRWDECPSFQRRLFESSLVVIDHLATTILEAVAANVPMIAYWNPNQWEVREEAQPYCDALKEAGILWDSPEEAARQTQAVWENPAAWWSGTRIQEARLRFFKRFAWSRPDWTEDWAVALTRPTVLD